MTPLTTVAAGDGSLIIRSRQAIVWNDDEWRALWAAHMGPEGAPPPVDFTTEMVAAAFLGERPTPGYSVEIVARASEDAGVTLDAVTHQPPPGQIAAQIVTSPFQIVRFPRPTGPVRWTDDQKGAQTFRSADTETSTTGFDVRTASALAYLVGPISGALILFAESRSQAVRFHAWQSIVALGGLWLIGFACYLLAFAMLLISATGFPILLWTASLVWLVWAGVWLYCMWQAWSGRRVRIPVAAEVADRFAPVRG
ncbi:MAG TPA: protease complex subunit PrcB family protein [Vicinamibacterales bacterium]|nr:protease complex subunit PrcB family protein [Vicinamibacterales bacterium]